jgi:uncharacterized membrane protein
MTLTPLYWLLGAYFALIAARAAKDQSKARRGARSAFFAILAILFLLGDLLPSALAGLLVLALAVIAGYGLPHHASSIAVAPSAERKGRRSLLAPILTIPLVTIILSLSLPYLHVAGVAEFNKTAAALYGLTVACVLALALALKMTREPAHLALARGGDLLESVGWAVLLPLLLAVLGTLFAKAGVGDALADLIGRALPLDVRWVAVVAYGLGMALLTMAMGNAFAAFPVIVGGIGMPFLVGVHGADPAPMAAIGMLSGYCGTLMTPMAANFNLVPVALLDLKDPHAVIRAQIPTAIPLLGANLFLLGWLCFR